MLRTLIALVGCEVALLLPLACILRHKSLVREFSGFYAYLWIYILSDVLYLFSRGLLTFSVISLRTAQEMYNYPNAFLYLLQSVITIWLIYKLFQMATSGVPGLQKLGAMAFQWATVIALIMAFAAIFTPHDHYDAVMGLILLQVGRSTSILALCLVTFLAFTAQKLGMGYGSRVFGVSFGLAMLATNQLVRDALLWSATTSAHGIFINVMGEFPQLLAMSLWLVYFLKAEPERKLVTVPIDSPLIQWNEVARLLGNPSGQVVISAPSTFAPGVRDIPAEPAVATPRRQGFGVVS